MVDEYRQITAKITGAAGDWQPDINNEQRGLIWDTIFEWGIGIKTLEIKSISGEPWGYSIKLFSNYSEDFYIGDGETLNEAFMEAFMRWYPEYNG